MRASGKLQRERGWLMLTAESYQLGLFVYVGAALLALLAFNLWFLRGRSWGIRALLSLPLGTLLLTPALIEPGAQSMAPALIVLAFQFLQSGPDAAEHAMRPLLLFAGVAFGVGAVIALFDALRGRGREA